MKPHVLLIKSGGAAALPEWRAEFARWAPGLAVHDWDDPAVAPDAVTYVLVWEPEPGRLARFPNLRLILSAAAGVDHILADSSRPPEVPVVRMVTGETRQRMTEFVALAALALIRQLPAIIAAQHAARWDESLTGRLASDTRVGILGLGELGSAAARTLSALGFQVSGWSRSPKSIDAVHSHHGEDGLDTLLAQSDLLVNLLPDTAATRRVLDARRLARLPRGAALINVGRGSHLDPDALLAALDDGHLSAAVLDVFDVEPLPASSRFWQHPKVIVTPHVASNVSRRARAQQAAATIENDLRGGQPKHRYDAVAGY
ncbi:MAG: glyoxylate/hydroxypyruvate reductase A [Burkholderia sp.]